MGSSRPQNLQISLLLIATLAILEAMAIMGQIPLLQIPRPSLFSTLVVMTATSSGIVIIFRRSLGTILGLLASSYEMALGAGDLVTNGSTATSVSILRGTGTVALGALVFVALMFSPSRSEAPTVSARENESEYTIVLEDVRKKYAGSSAQIPAVDGLSLKIRRGEFVAIMGPSGSGKSTLLNLLGALDKPTSGRVWIDGVDISTLDEDGLARLRNAKLGFVFQSYNLIPRSRVFRNIELPAIVRGLPRAERTKRVENLLSAVSLPTMGGRRPNMLSGGEQQRVAIARALMNRPPIILADEPTGNLDSKNASEVMNFLRRMREEIGSTMIMVTHNKEIGDLADRIIYLKDGKVVGEEILRKATQSET